MKTLEEIRTAALLLPLSERIALAEELAGSVADQPSVREEDLPAVLASRLAALDRGEMEVIDGATALAEIRRELRRRPRPS